ncbi:LysR family transcriptional regulator [Nocardioides flavescens]|uniref:LysR family transcriptional regulator n=1 Tax=Nocardioides flavescens TaxID=2691959 RepID=A0A6L7ER04_9ACTN|nr:LysR family transcriptional regulator [Nocardioides flavescens]MXG88016.1 LysR family transcriptional regulator [Nocardioides flavescens]
MLVRDLAWLVRLAETGHVTDAAASLGTTQPTLSRALARIEEELGSALFVRTPHGVRPTPAGALAVEAAQAVTARWTRLVDELAALRDPDSGTVRLAFLDSIATSLVPGLLRDFHAHAPATRVLLSQEPAHEILDDLDSGAADLAVTSFGVDERFGWHPLAEERLVVVVPPTHRFAGRRRLALADLEGEELVTTPVGFGFRTLVDSLLSTAGVSLPISFESQDLATITGLVAAGLGIAVVPEPFAGQSGTVGIALRAPGARRTIGLAWSRRRVLPAPAERLRAFVVARAEGSGAEYAPGP